MRSKKNAEMIAQSGMQSIERRAKAISTSKPVGSSDSILANYRVVDGRADFVAFWARCGGSNFGAVSAGCGGADFKSAGGG